MIKENGRVVAIEENCLWVETIRKTTCNSCSAQKGCGHGILNKMDAGRQHHVRVLLRDLPSSDFSINDEVEISIPEQVLVRGAFIVYLFPLISLFAVAGLANNLWPGDIPAFIGSVLGFGLGVAGVKIHSVVSRDNVDMQPSVRALPQSQQHSAVQAIQPI